MRSNEKQKRGPRINHGSIMLQLTINSGHDGVLELLRLRSSSRRGGSGRGAGWWIFGHCLDGVLALWAIVFRYAPTTRVPPRSHLTSGTRWHGKLNDQPAS